MAEAYIVDAIRTPVAAFTAAARQIYVDKRNAANENRRKSEADASKANIEAGATFLAELDQDPSVQNTKSGLCYSIDEEGGDERPTASSTVKVNYRGTRISGEEFDSSYKRGEPASFPLNGVIKGWTEGLQLIGEGGKIKLYVPPDLAYGNSPRRGGVIQPGDTLIFDIELLEIVGSSQPAARPKPARPKPAPPTAESDSGAAVQ